MGDLGEALVGLVDPLDVAALRLGEGRFAAVGAAGLGVRRPAATPLVGVVAVGVHAVGGQAVGGVLLAGDAAVGQLATVLAPVLAEAVAGRRGGIAAEDRDADADLMGAGLDGELAGEVEAVDVDDRDDDVAYLADEVGDPLLRGVGLSGLVGAVALDQVVGPHDRHLAGRPLAGVVHAVVVEDRTTVVAVDVGADLQPIDGPLLQGLVGQLDQLDQAGVVRGQRRHVGVVVVQPAVLPRLGLAGLQPDRANR